MYMYIYICMIYYDFITKQTYINYKCMVSCARLFIHPISGPSTIHSIQLSQSSETRYPSPHPGSRKSLK